VYSTCPCPLPTLTSIREMSSEQTLDLYDDLWIPVFEAVLEPKGPSQEVLPLLYVCKRWKVQLRRPILSLPASNLALSQVLARPLLYRHIILQDQSSVLALADIFGALGFADNTPARWTRSLAIEGPSFTSNHSPFFVALTVFIVYATGLTVLDTRNRPVPSSVLAALQHPGRSPLRHLGIALYTEVPSTLSHISRFHQLRKLHLWLPMGDDRETLIQADAPAWTLPLLEELDVSIEEATSRHEQELLGFFVRCSFSGLRRFAWINSDSLSQWETETLAQLLDRNLTLTQLHLRLVDQTDLALARVLPHAACPHVTLIDPYLADQLEENPLSPCIEELVLVCHWERGFPENWMVGVWCLLDAILQYHREENALSRIVISKISGRSFGWLDDGNSDEETLTARSLATYIPELRERGIALLDGNGMELHLQRPPA
jgi:hypothetical protein